MTQEEKDLLLKDLCGRIMYGVKCTVYEDANVHTLSGVLPGNVYNELYFRELDWKECDGFVGVEYCKPYLFPLSSMTKEQYEEWCDLETEPLDEILTRNANGEKMSTLEHHLLIAKSLTDSVNYCYKNHFDIYGLIPMGLAIDATGLNIY